MGWGESCPETKDEVAALCGAEARLCALPSWCCYRSVALRDGHVTLPPLPLPCGLSSDVVAFHPFFCPYVVGLSLSLGCVSVSSGRRTRCSEEVPLNSLC